ncbi:MAG: PAS domain-containing protein [Cyclobacteriaceae bacterium]|nr:PAS domain-containing protein [Cyclobacteriaceae bacterium]MCH8516798.1 PAS domain-containing protein [Cyclobacteriaceae bacterium]
MKSLASHLFFEKSAEALLLFEFRSVLHPFPNSFVSFFSECQLQDINASALNQLHYGDKSMVPDQFFDIYSAWDFLDSNTLFLHLQKQHQAYFECVRRKGRKEVQRLKGKISITEYEGKTYVLLFHKDTTAEHQEIFNLNKNIRQYSLAMEGNKDGVWTWDLITHDVFFSRKWKLMMGFQEDELEDSFDTFTNLLHPDYIEPVFSYLNSFLRGEQTSFEMEFRFRHKSGHYLWISSRAAYLSDQKGMPYLLAGSHTDITERKNFEERLESNGRLLNEAQKLSNMGAWEVDLETGKSKWSDQVYVIKEVDKHYQGDTEIDISFYEPSYQPMVRESINKAISEQLKFDFEAKIITALKNKKWVRVVGEPVVDNAGKVVKIVGMFQDITQRKKNEFAMIEAKMKAERANAAKSTFLANMSHEIRTPLNGVIGFAQLLSKTHLNEEQGQYVKTIKSSADHLLGLINDILDFSKIEAGKMKVQPEFVHLERFVDEVLDIVRLQAHRKGLELLFDWDEHFPYTMKIDGVRLKQVLVNLLSNAIKFTHKGRVTLTIKYIRTTNKNRSKFRFSVIDTGIGIEEKKLKQIIQPFLQGDNSTTRKFGGTGLGLTITHRLIEMMDSKLMLDSTRHVGSLFYFDIDCECQEKALPILPKDKIKQVLIIEPKTYTRNQVVKIIQALGLSYSLIKSTDQIKQMVLQNDDAYDLIIYNQLLRENEYGLFKDMISLSSKKSLFLELKSGQKSKAPHPTDKRILSLEKPVSPRLFTEFLAAALEQKSEDSLKVQPKEEVKIATILIAEDNATNMYLAKSIIKKAFPYAEIIPVVDGEQAVKAFKRYKPEIILMDIQMPKLNGIEAMKAIRKNQKDNYLMIALTAGNLKVEREEAIQAGADEYLLKPIDSEKLVDVISRYLSHRSTIERKTEEPTTASANTKRTYDKVLKELNFDQLLARMGNEEEFAQEILSIALADLKKKKEEISRHLAGEHLLELSKVVHAIVGMAKTACLDKLSYEAANAKLVVSDEDDVEAFRLIEDKTTETIYFLENELAEMKHRA